MVKTDQNSPEVQSRLLGSGGSSVTLRPQDKCRALNIGISFLRSVVLVFSHETSMALHSQQLTSDRQLNQLTKRED